MKKLTLALAGLLTLTACGSQATSNTSQNATQPAASSAASGGTDQTSATLTIFAAASLKDVFPKIYEEFKKTHPHQIGRRPAAPVHAAQRAIKSGKICG